VIGQLGSFTINDQSHLRQIGKNCEQGNEFYTS
jgi:hypothetical protein